MTTNYPGSVDSFDTHVDNVDDVMAADVNNLQDAVVALETYAAKSSLVKVENDSGAAALANEVGYINEAGKYKTTTTEALGGVAWCVVIEGGANGADIIVSKSGQATVELDQNCSAGDYLYTSTTAGQATTETFVRPEVFAVALTANSGGAGGTCEALLLCSSPVSPVIPSDNWHFGANISDNDFVSTIATLPGGAVLTYGAVTSGAEENIVPQASTYLAKMVLHNTTRGDDALIDAVVVGTNTITLTAAVPGTWQVGDAITTRSQTNTGNPVGGVYYSDFEIVSDMNALARYMIVTAYMLDTGAAGNRIWFHPYEANDTAKRQSGRTQVANVPYDWLSPQLPIINNRITLAWEASGAGAFNLNVKLATQGVASP